MKNVSTIANLARHLKASAERMSELAYDVDSAEDGFGPEYFGDLMDEQFMSELEFAQKCLIMLTSLVIKPGEEAQENADGDGSGSVFAEGDLSSAKAEGNGGEENK